MGYAERDRRPPWRPLLIGMLLGLAVGGAVAQVDPSPARVAPNPGLPVLPSGDQGAANRWTPQALSRAFTEADTDGNGELTRAEALRLAYLPRSFEELDANRDGVLTGEEYAAATP
ncbi:EF-hand domain-containing protein [Ramlibacter tataouinensis]|uniref:EF-hand domain-containing protein n=1 Tax=Ramlibacter tataouinensis (strain ATCC BAA-407 / DSM 14655 / LMG 21543 / TTB310) TaxID=365046 RepID=F5Y2H3_RAMTT|nr:EF-hand domain-containing protein [Ramlibacter tataouinensis]AEG91147.1 Hypothetical protein Rta_00860 [Ramlibacter tataouinensis TTB310]